jgi:hypothetical protein
MKRDEDISILLTNKNFQKILSAWSGYTEDEKAEIFTKYQLSQEEVNSLQQLWLGLDFHFQEHSSVEIENALDKTIWEIAERRISPSVKSIGQKMYEEFSKIAAILIIPLILYSGYSIYKSSTSFASEEANQMININSQPGTITKLVLPDGTKVSLNAGSTITYPNKFTGTNREVSLTGEAYFEVTKNKEMPMEISAGSISLKVYGTSFNVNAYPEEEFARTTLIEGSVSLSSPMGKFNGKDEFFIEPGQTVTFYTSTRKLEIGNEDPFQFMAWKDGFLVFKNTSFGSVLEQLSRRFNVEIELLDKSLSSISMDATFQNENINEILRLIALGTPFKYYYKPMKKLPDGSFEKSKIYIDNIKK